MITIDHLKSFELTPDQIETIIAIVNQDQETKWQLLIDKILMHLRDIRVHEYLYQTIYPNWENVPAPAWFPTEKYIKATHLHHSIDELKLNNYHDFHRWSVEHFTSYWQHVIEKLNIKFDIPYSAIVDMTAGIETPKWLPDAKFNIAENCFNAAETDIAIIYRDEHGQTTRCTYGELKRQSLIVANNIIHAGFQPGDVIAINMPMSIHAISIYLGVILAGCCVCCIAESFASPEIESRLRIGNAKAVFTDAVIHRGGKSLPLYTKVTAANAPQIIVYGLTEDLGINLRTTDITWEQFQKTDQPLAKAIRCGAEDFISILFSSGTTGDPKAIPWTHATPIKCAADAYYHLDLKPEDRYILPTSLGWMMGPWHIFATLINRGTMAIFGGAPLTRTFGQFIEDEKINVIGIVPSIVASWRTTRCMEELNWKHVKLFSSTGECSNTMDMLYLMALAKYKPVIEYCGGTEIAGAYITSTLIEPNAPSTFTTAALGLDFTILDTDVDTIADKTGKSFSEFGEVALIPPSIGLSTQLLNHDHHQVYYADMPKLKDATVLRRHGDVIRRIDNPNAVDHWDFYYRIQGRADDTMNLGGIKVSAAEIERCLGLLPMVSEVAAIGISQFQGGPEHLHIVAVTTEKIAEETSKLTMQNCIREHLNPLFKIHAVHIVDALPRTASNKVMRRLLRDQYRNS